MKKYVVLLVLLTLASEVSSYNYIGWDKFVDDVKILVTNQSGDLAPSTTTTLPPEETTTMSTLPAESSDDTDVSTTTTTTTLSDNGRLLSSAVSYLKNAVGISAADEEPKASSQNLQGMQLMGEGSEEESDSVIESKDGGIQFHPNNNRMVLDVSNFTIERPDGQKVCCGPDNNNQWVCNGGMCNV